MSAGGVDSVCAGGVDSVCAGGVDQELFDGGNLMMSDSISPQASPRRSREMMSSQSPDAYDAYVENSELRSQLKMVKRQLMQALSPARTEHTD